MPRLSKKSWKNTDAIKSPKQIKKHRKSIDVRARKNTIDIGPFKTDVNKQSSQVRLCKNLIKIIS